ncbi:hypothetical protein ACHAWF_015760 [Thalassiosira exigua]
MDNLSSLLAFAAVLHVSAFSRTSSVSTRNLDTSQYHRMITAVHVATATSSVDEKVTVNTAVPVSRVSVCAGELCQCQGEQYEYTGGAADAAIEKLRGLDLPFPLDEVGCLGACGMGTMIAIDYENGDSIMTDGLDSTLVELGIEGQRAKPVFETELKVRDGHVGGKAAVETESKINDAYVGDKTVGNAVGEPDSSMSFTASSAATVGDNEHPDQVKPPMLADVRERMREEAAVKAENPWMNMASYLAKKATDKLFGEPE